MRIITASLALLLFVGCTSGLLTNEATEQVDKAKTLQLELELRNAAQAQEQFYAIQGTYTTDIGALNLNPVPEVALTITVPAADQYCIQAVHSSLGEDHPWHVSKADPSPVEGPC
ncbi:MAG TPA: hypothetical protein VE174_10440 [Actinomycetota bacterium]|nr:hypothetical protein [Actinomycetota bacterium]